MEGQAGPLWAHIRQRAFDLGFHAVGVVRAGALHEDRQRLDSWLAAGRHGAMAYMARNVDLREDPRLPNLVDGARSVICLAMAYPAERGDGLTPLIARYARGQDYHLVLRRGARTLLREVLDLCPGERGRAFVDTAPVLERAWAARAGLGFIGRNTCLINPQLGSWIVLAELVLTVDVDELASGDDGALEVEGCETCRKCLSACPTGALRKPDGYVLDARRCLSYWTVEPTGPLPSALAEGATILFGCDKCQQVCPWNKGATSPPSTGLVPHRRWSELSLVDVAQMELEAVTELIHDTPLKRKGADQVRARARALLRQSTR